MADTNLEELVSLAVDTGFHIHDTLGPGLLESVYETVLATRLMKVGVSVERQKPVDIVIDEIRFNAAYRVDLLLNGRLVIEVKAIDTLSGLHIRQTLTYIKLLKQPLGLLMNFGGESWKGSVRRVMNNDI